MCSTEILMAYCTSMNKPKTAATNFSGRYAITKEELSVYKSQLGMKTNNGMPLAGRPLIISDILEYRSKIIYFGFTVQSTETMK